MCVSWVTGAQILIWIKSAENFCEGFPWKIKVRESRIEQRKFSECDVVLRSRKGKEREIRNRQGQPSWWYQLDSVLTNSVWSSRAKMPVREVTHRQNGQAISQSLAQGCPGWLWPWLENGDRFWMHFQLETFNWLYSYNSRDFFF